MSSILPSFPMHQTRGKHAGNVCLGKKMKGCSLLEVLIHYSQLQNNPLLNTMNLNYV